MHGQNLGVSLASINVTYTGGSDGMVVRTFQTDPCTVAAAGTVLQCPSVPGVGANYSFVVAVEGISSPNSVQLLSYEPPSITFLDGPGAERGMAKGGQEINLHGSNFGPADGNTVVAAWASPTSLEAGALEFPAVNCTVTREHVTVTCNTTSVIGAFLSWHVVVEGQSNTLPQSTVAAPVVSNVTLASASVTWLSPVGGTAVYVDGLNFGTLLSYVTVSASGSGGALALACTFVQFDVRLSCVFPAGVGVVSILTLAVLGQSTTFSTYARVSALLQRGQQWCCLCATAQDHQPTAMCTCVCVRVCTCVCVRVCICVCRQGLAFELPVISGLSVVSIGTDASAVPITITGSGFGSPATSSLVRVTATAVLSCGGDSASGTFVTRVQLLVRDSSSQVVDDVLGGVPLTAYRQGLPLSTLRGSTLLSAPVAR